MAITTELDDLIESILRMSPPTLGGADRARENLRAMPYASLQDMHSRLTAELERTRPDAEAAKARHELLLRRRGPKHPTTGVQGLARLKAVRDEICADRRALRVDQVSPAEPPQVVAIARPAVRFAGGGGSEPAPQTAATLRADPAEAQSPGDSWLHPLLIHGASNVGRLEPLQGSFAMRMVVGAFPHHRPAVVSVDESVLGVEEFQDVISHRIARLLEHSRVPESSAEDLSRSISTLLRNPVFEKYLQVHTASMMRDVLSLALTHHSTAASSSDYVAALMQRLRTRLRVPSSSTETTFLPERPSVVGEISAIDGFAKMIVRMREYAPECVVVLKGGGEIAGKLLERAYGGSARFVVHDPGGSAEVPRGRRSRCTSVLVVDDISRTGATMRRSLDSCRAAYGGASVRGMALVGTVESAEVLGDEAFFANLSPDVAIGVPWNTHGQYHATVKDHVLGFGKPDSLPIGKLLLTRAVGRLAAQSEG